MFGPSSHQQHQQLPLQHQQHLAAFGGAFDHSKVSGQFTFESFSSGRVELWHHCGTLVWHIWREDKSAFCPLKSV